MKTWLQAIKAKDDFHRLAAEYADALSSRALWAKSPYPSKFVTADLLVRWGGKILLIRRDKNPAAGLIALPGGHLEGDETLFECALREGSEETGLPIEDLSRYFVGRRIFDDPERDPRGRYITECFFFDIPGEPPKVTPSDDAREAFWALPNEHHSDAYALDHWFIQQAMLKMAK